MKLHHLVLLLMAFISCTSSESKTAPLNPQHQFIESSDWDYKLYKQQDQKALLILYPGMGGSAKNIESNFAVLDEAEKQGISVLLMNFTNHLFLDENQKRDLTQRLLQIIAKEELNTDHVCIGGFSSGGLISVLLSNYLVETNSGLDIEEVFLVDSPLDLVQLYELVTDVDENSHEMSRREAEFLVGYFQEKLPQEGSLLGNIAKVSPYVESTKNFENMKHLKAIDFRIYTEPDSTWWRENRGKSHEDSNAYLLKNFKKVAEEEGWQKVELIETKNKGYRANGDRHPHSWSIVDAADLLAWITKND